MLKILLRMLDLCGWGVSIAILIGWLAHSVWGLVAAFIVLCVMIWVTGCGFAGMAVGGLFRDRPDTAADDAEHRRAAALAAADRWSALSKTFRR